MRKSLVVYGPAMCGKTRNAERLRIALGLDRICDDGRFAVGINMPINPYGDLILTENNDKYPGYDAMPFRDAMFIARLS